MEKENKTFVLIGGGEIRNKTTLQIDEYIVSLAKAHAGDKRPRALFIGTASHDFMPYFNSFRKTYTGVFDVKVDCLLTVYTTYDKEKMAEKFALADVIYVGGGDTLYMIDKWKETGVDEMILSAYFRGVPVCGLSAGAICWFEDIYTDSADGDNLYAFAKGMGILKGACSPHFNKRIEDLKPAFLKTDLQSILAIEDDCAVVYENGKMKGAITSGGKAYIMRKNVGETELYEINKFTE